jgi:Holliday junction resolvase RusA-like endonuclease
MSDKLSFTVPLTPPSVNMYVRHYRSGAHVKTNEAIAFQELLAVKAKRRYVVGKRFRVTILIVLGKGDRGDIDNFPKLVLDGLAKYGAFQSPRGKVLSDAHVIDLRVALDRNLRPDQGQTEITVEALT